MSHNDVLCRSCTRYDPSFKIGNTIATAIMDALVLIVLRAFSATKYRVHIVVIAGDFASESRAKGEENASYHLRDT